MATKRKIEGPLDVAFTKRPRPSYNEENVIPEAHLTEEELTALPHEDLVQTAITLQKALVASFAAAAAVVASVPATKVASTNVWTPEKITEKAKTIRLLVHKEIKKQMKWQPSCKTGKTKWSYKGMVPCEEVFAAIFGGMEAGKKKMWKMKKFSRGEFEGMFGHISASCRYNDLGITSESINVKWDPEELTFQMSGTYGI